MNIKFMHSINGLNNEINEIKISGKCSINILNNKLLNESFGKC